MTPALFVECRKVASSVVVRSATALLVLGIVGISASLSLAIARGDEQARAKLGPLADKQGWDQLTGMTAMISAPAALLGFGTVLSWMIGREFADGTICGLFALPVSRRALATAKLIVFGCWTAAVAVIVAVSCAALGLALGYGLPQDADIAGLVRLLAVGLLTGLLAAPAGWAATLGRGLLPGIATTVVMIALGQILVAAGVGAWFPVAAPALWAVFPDDVSELQLTLVPITALVVAAMTARAWQQLQLDK
jgi:ABC-2 type transport system permease protein